MERKIGEIFEYNDEWYQCLENNSYCCGCDYCDFGELGDCDIIACSSSERNDNKEVYFKKLEKVGEPYEYFVQHKGIVMLQPYKLLATPFINGVVCNVNYDTNTIDLEIKQNKEDMEEYRMHDSKEDIPEFDKVVDECLFGENKLNLKPFDIEAAKAGKPVCTRDGRKARIICFDKVGDFPIVALTDDRDYKEDGVNLYDINGKGSNECFDLMMLPEKKDGWINIYNADTTFYYVDGRVFETKDEAVQEAKEEVEKGQREKNEYIDTIRVEWEE